MLPPRGSGKVNAMRTKLAVAIAGAGLVLAGTAGSVVAHHAFSAEFDANRLDSTGLLLEAHGGTLDDVFDIQERVSHRTLSDPVSKRRPVHQLQALHVHRQQAPHPVAVCDDRGVFPLVGR